MAHPPLEELTVLSFHDAKKGKPPQVKEFVHVGAGDIPGTGEIVPADGMTYTSLNLVSLYTERRKVLKALRPEVREFVLFVLCFRNNRRGITPDVGVLCKWYAKLKGLRVDNVRRYIAVLRKADVLVNDDSVGRLWQKTGAKPKDVYAETCVANNRFMLQVQRRFSQLAQLVTPELSACNNPLA
ncbi:hypothetical protein KXJ72_05480 [Comamonas aquatica]|nr:hypothetical protein KXJ72_05480 [Comamonas aquatica]